MDSGELPLCIAAERLLVASVDIAHVSSTSTTKWGWLFDLTEVSVRYLLRKG